MTKNLPIILTFSATDPTAGAGLQADCLTVSSLGAHSLNILTAITAQNTQGVQSVEPLSKNSVLKQLDVLLEDEVNVQVIKAGVLASCDTIHLLAEFVQDTKLPLVLDPVLASGRGDAFGNDELIQVMTEALFPVTTLITPNWPEGKKLTGKRTAKSVAKALLDRGCQAVLLKGEHIKSDLVLNRLFHPDGEVEGFECLRLPNQFHGSGCTLASAIAVGMAQGLNLSDSVKLGLDYTFGALSHAFVIGKGQLIPDRMHVMQYFAEQM